MYWTIRGVLEDRPGTLAALALACGEHNLNILGLQIFPTADGRVLDELVLQTSVAVTARDLEALCHRVGLQDLVVSASSAHALEDQPVRYLRAAAVAVRQPHRLKELLPALAGSAGKPATETEQARASAFSDLVAAATLGPWQEAAESPGPRDPHRLLLRETTSADMPGLIALHARCSSDTLFRRYNALVPRLTARPALLTLLQPSGGRSVALLEEDTMVAHGMVAAGPQGLDLGLLVEDCWQRLGLGTRLLNALAQDAARTGHQSLNCLVQPDNHAILVLVRRAGLRARVRSEDGLVRISISLGAVTRQERSHVHAPSEGAVTRPLVALLHRRPQLREINPLADLLDQAIRDGA